MMAPGGTGRPPSNASGVAVEEKAASGASVEVTVSVNVAVLVHTGASTDSAASLTDPIGNTAMSKLTAKKDLLSRRMILLYLYRDYPLDMGRDVFDRSLRPFNTEIPDRSRSLMAGPVRDQRYRRLPESRGQMSDPGITRHDKMTATQQSRKLSHGPESSRMNEWKIA
jgi:hypothetical protein